MGKMKETNNEVEYYKNKYNELKRKYDDLDFAHLALTNEFKDQQELKNKSHFNNAKLRKENERLRARLAALDEE